MAMHEAPHEAPAGGSPAARPGRHRLLPIAGGGLAVAALVAHFGGGALLVHVGVPAVVASLGLGVALPSLGGGGLVVGLGAFGVLALVHLLVVRGAWRVLATATRNRTEPPVVTTGTTLRRARSYDRHAALLALGRMRALRESTIALARIAPGDAVLDVGCGTGDLTLLAGAAAGPGGRVSGIDASPQMVAEARRRAARAGAAVDYRVAAVEALPFAAASFDVVLGSLMVHHLPDDLKDRALAEVRRVLRPGGRLLVVDFRRPTSLRERLALPFLLHPQWRRLPSGVQDLPPRLAAAGFVAVEAGETGYGPVGYARARAGPVEAAEPLPRSTGRAAGAPRARG